MVIQIFFIQIWKNFLKISHLKKKNIDFKLLSREITTPFKKTFSFLQKHGNLYSFWTMYLRMKV